MGNVTFCLSCYKDLIRSMWVAYQPGINLVPKLFKITPMEILMLHQWKSHNTSKAIDSIWEIQWLLIPVGKLEVKGRMVEWFWREVAGDEWSRHWVRIWCMGQLVKISSRLWQETSVGTVHKNNACRPCKGWRTQANSHESWWQYKLARTHLQTG
jgi:hypothetical protein